MKKQKTSNTIEHRLTRVEDTTKSLFDEIKLLKTELTSALEKTNSDLKILLDRKQEHEAVKSFLTSALKLSAAIFGFVGSIATFMWAATQVYAFFHHLL